jgi:tetratricopeptide (TPR) repeat protein
MRIRSEYILLFALGMLLIILPACSRELTSGDERPMQPFPFDRIPALTEGGAISPVQPEGQLSAGGTEPVAQTPAASGEEEEAAEDPAIAGLLDGGRDALRSGQYDLAIEYFSAVLERDANNTAALYNLGYAYRQLGNPDKAVEYARRAVDSDPTRLYVHQGLGYAYEDQGNIDAAIAEFEQELLNHPDEPGLASVAERLAQIYLQRGLQQEAFDAAKRAVDLEPDVASHHATLAAAHMANHAYPQAVEALEKAVSLDPDTAKYHKSLGDALWEAGRHADAREQYEKAIELDPDLAAEIDQERLRSSPADSQRSPSDSPM